MLQPKLLVGLSEILTPLFPLIPSLISILLIHFLQKRVLNLLILFQEYLINLSHSGLEPRYVLILHDELQ